ncbi:hypothetical protein SLEP1_g17303 [Rubroshorea leprosula]|uniref:CASP-like protein n=1 Tax=Rubroshorea leprosula TaxID=152421 RepID=A0AAV5J5J3_9ROSI|nr:hypothetical protein SLEP1_g17303 [Rubroshorea leprosula]
MKPQAGSLVNQTLYNGETNQAHSKSKAADTTEKSYVFIRDRDRDEETRYVFYTAVVAAAYTLLQIPFAIYNLKNDKRMINFLRKFDFYADGLISLLLGTGVDAGFAVTNELKQLIDHLIFEDWGTDDPKSAFANFLNKVYGGTGLLLGAFICMIVLLALSSANRNARDSSLNNNYSASIQL